jgi:hypothetical protein
MLMHVTSNNSPEAGPKDFYSGLRYCVAIFILSRLGLDCLSVNSGDSQVQL